MANDADQTGAKMLHSIDDAAHGICVQDISCNPVAISQTGQLGNADRPGNETDEVAHNNQNTPACRKRKGRRYLTTKMSPSP